MRKRTRTRTRKAGKGWRGSKSSRERQQKKCAGEPFSGKKGGGREKTKAKGKGSRQNEEG